MLCFLQGLLWDERAADKHPLLLVDLVFELEEVKEGNPADVDSLPHKKVQKRVNLINF